MPEPDDLAWHEQYPSGDASTSQSWPPEPTTGQHWSAELTGEHDNAATRGDLPWPAELADDGQDNGATAPAGLPWLPELADDGQDNGATAPAGLPWLPEPTTYDELPEWSQRGDLEPPPTGTWGAPIAPSPPADMDSSFGQDWSANPQGSQEWDARSESSASGLLGARRVALPADTGAARDGGRRGPLAIAIAIPLIISLVLVVMAGPGRILPARDRQATAKRPVATPVQPGDANRLVSLINQERARKGLPGFLVLRRLNAVAAAHSAEMASQKRIHPDPNVAVSARPATSVSQYVDCASNVDQAYRRIMASATFRAKVLSPSLNGIGLGTVSGTCLWVTVLFAKAVRPASAAKPAGPIGGGPLPKPSSAGATVTTRPASSTQGPARPSNTAEAIVKDLFTRVNAERKARGLAQLAWDDDLARLATDWSRQMARTNQFVHRDLDAARSEPGIAQFSALAENIAWVRGYSDDGYELHLGWMRSEGHRHNLLQPGFDSIGIGVVCSGGRAWATQNFGRLSASTPALSNSIPATEPIVATAKDGLTCG